MRLTKGDIIKSSQAHVVKFGCQTLWGVFHCGINTLRSMVHLATLLVHLATLLGHLATLLDHLATLLGHMTTLLDHLATLLDHLATLLDHLLHYSAIKVH